jgi:hypothetical protein
VQIATLGAWLVFASIDLAFAKLLGARRQPGETTVPTPA